MYEDYLQNFWDYVPSDFQNTYDQMNDNYQYGYNRTFPMYDYNYFMPDYEMRGMSNKEMEGQYPEIYKIIYPMVKKVCSKNYRVVTGDIIQSMVEEVYDNIETNNLIDLNITINNEVRGEKKQENTKQEENRGRTRNNTLMDIIKILVIRELLGRQGCRHQNPRPNMRPPRPPYPRFE